MNRIRNLAQAIRSPVSGGWLIAALVACACSGAGGTQYRPDLENGSGAAGQGGTLDESGEDATVDCSLIQPGPAPLRRLTRVEYDQTVFQLLGDDSGLARAFAAEEEALGFNNQATAQTVSPVLAEQYMEAAETLAEAHAETLLEELPACANGIEARSTCIEEFEGFFQEFGRRAFRRPLSDDALSRYVQYFEEGLQAGQEDFDPALGMRLLLETVLQAPEFLYRVEFGEPEPVQGDVVKLTGYEVAARLSYLFWNTMPDAPLFEAAENDELGTPQGIEAHARRLLSAERARQGVKNFHRQWLNLKNIDSIISAGKDVTLFPDYDETVFPLLRQETEQFFEHVVFDGNGTVAELFSAPYTFLNARLAEYYRIEDGLTGEAFERVDLDPNIYAGFLTQAGLLALNAKPNRTSPLHRGWFVRETLLCQTPPPPPDIVPEAPEVDPEKTTREQFSMHQAEPVCAGCHQMLDPIGFGFEQFDATGRYREMEAGRPIDATGELVQTLDIDGPFDGAAELGSILAGSSQVQDCVSTQWFRFAYGRAADPEDACSQAQLSEAFGASGHNIRELLIGLTQTDAFRYRHRVVAPPIGEGVGDGTTQGGGQ